MPEYERSQAVDVPADRLFAYLSDVRNLPDFLPRMTKAEPLGGDKVATAAVIDDGGGEREVEGEAWMRVDEAERRIEWGSPGPDDYHGHLEVRGDGSGAELRIAITTDHQDGERIEKELGRAADAVRAKAEEVQAS